MMQRKIRRYLQWYRAEQGSDWANAHNSSPLADVRAVIAMAHAMPSYRPPVLFVHQWMSDRFAERLQPDIDAGLIRVYQPAE